MRYGVLKARLASGPFTLAPARVNTVHESRRGARPAEARLPDPAPVQDPGMLLLATYYGTHVGEGSGH